MLAGIGVDIVEIDRFRRMIERYGDRVARRLLTEGEFDQYLRRNKSATFLATRFAAKEAVSKAMGTGMAQGIGFHGIEVFNDTNGKPDLLFHGKAKEVLEKRYIQRWMLSLSDEKHYAVAMVALETE